MKKTLLFVAVMHILSNTVFADIHNYELQAIGSVEITDDDTTLENNLKTFGIRANKRISDNWLAGLGYTKTNNADYKNGNANTDIDRYFVNTFYEFEPNENYTPYLIAGLGYQDIQEEFQNFESGIVGQAGIGLKTNITQYLQLLLEGKYMRDFKNSANDFILSAGLSIPFGYKSKPAPIDNEPKPVSKPKDSDKDGVVDIDDLCPDTPLGIKVGSDGCPFDSDKDGVYDYQDKCPATPKEAMVDENGCCLDSDNDGVPDFKDKCPDTPEGFQVDQHGCPLIYNFMINFDYNSAKIKTEYLAKIKEFAEFMKKNRPYKAEIQGHTDNIGSKKYNKKLSLQRAKSVYDMLIKLGVEANRLTYVGFGEEKPIADNNTENGRAKNRRVEAHLFY